MDYYPVDLFNISRKSRDEIVNNFGRSLLSLCPELDVHTLNGRNGKDLNDEFTYLSRVMLPLKAFRLVKLKLNL